MMGNFTPNTELYGRRIKVHAADSDTTQSFEAFEGKLIEIRGPHDYLIERDNGEREVWTCDSVDDLEILDDECLILWNAFR